MIDATPQQSRDYLKTIEAPAVTQDKIDIKAHEILRGMSALDMSDALHDSLIYIRNAMSSAGNEQVIGEIVDNAVWGYCLRIARRELEA